MFVVSESIGVPPKRNHSLSHPRNIPFPLSTTYCHSRIQQTHQFNIAINFSLKVFTNFSVLNSLLLSLPFARIPSNCSSCEKMNCSASTYSSIVPAKNPVACAAPSASNRYFFPPRGNAGTTMSCLGPRYRAPQQSDLRPTSQTNAIATRNSTTLMPKCSSRIVCNPTEEEAKYCCTVS